MKLLILDFGGTSVKYATIREDGTFIEAGKKQRPWHQKCNSSKQLQRFMNNINMRYRGFQSAYLAMWMHPPAF